MSPFKRLTPVLPVADVASERAFYEQLGFRRFVNPREPYPESAFAAFESPPDILFGVSIAPGFDRDTAESRLWWQFEATDLEAIHARALAAGLPVEQAPSGDACGRRTLVLRSPNGYRVTFEQEP